MATRDDFEEIRRLVHAYPKLVDEGDLAGVADLFAHARLVSEDGHVLEGRDALYDVWRNAVILYDDGKPGTRHLVTNLDVYVEHDGTATATSTVLVVQALEQFPLQLVAVSRHDDRFEKVDGTWRITERRDTRLLTGDLSQHYRGAS